MSTTTAKVTPPSDEQVLARVLAGDVAAFELLMRRHNQRLYRVARSVVRDDLEAQDIVQEAYVRAYENLSRFEGRSSVATWLTRIAFHEALRRSRRRRREYSITSAMADQQPPGEREAEGREMTDDTETGHRLTEALDALPEGLRTVVVLRLVQGLSTRETAASLRLSEANVKVMLHRAKAMLRNHLDTPTIEPLREQYAFGAEHCDRVVAAVFRRIAQRVETHPMNDSASDRANPGSAW